MGTEDTTKRDALKFDNEHCRGIGASLKWYVHPLMLGEATPTATDGAGTFPSSISFKTWNPAVFIQGRLLFKNGANWTGSSVHANLYSTNK